LAHFREHENRLSSFSEHGGWPLAQPGAEDLAGEGFFYAPLPGCADRVACFACGKVLFNWDPNDDIKDAHKLFAPACPLVTGEPLPDAPPAQPAWAARPDAGLSSAAFKGAGLSSFVATLTQGASGGANGGSGPDMDFPSATYSGGEGQVSDEEVLGGSPAGGKGKRAHGAGPRGATKVPKEKASNEAIKEGADGKQPVTTPPGGVGGSRSRAQMLWSFDWSAQVMRATGLRGEGALLDAQAGELEMRAVNAARLLRETREDWECAARAAEAACCTIEAHTAERFGQADARVTEIGQRCERVAVHVAALRNDQLLGQRAAELCAGRVEAEALAAEREVLRGELSELRTQTEAERADIEIVRNKQKLNAELDAALDEKRARTGALEEAAERAVAVAVAAKEEKEAMEKSMVQVREELRDDISELHAQRLASEAALAEMSEQMSRVKTLYHEYRSRLDELQRREELVEKREEGARAREDGVSRRESTMQTREEWMARREAEHRTQQRALEAAQLLPKGTLLTAAAAAASRRPAAGGTGVGSAGDARGSTGEGSGSERDVAGGSEGSGPGGLAEQVAMAQAHYAARPLPGLAQHKGREAAQRDYKAILSTSESESPEQDREAAKAERRRAMLKSFMPSVSIGKRSKQPKDAPPASSALDMNAI